MKKYFMLIVMVYFSLPVLACDACGCSINGDGWGLMPNNNRHFVGMRFQYRHYHNVHPSDTETGFEVGDDHFYKADLIGRYSITKRFQMVGTFPYRFNDRYESGDHLMEKGLGDASLSLQYLPIVPGCNDFKHALQLNAGAEGPTGKFKFSHDIPANMQTGSGTWDYIVGISYMVRYKNIGLAIEGAYRFNGHTESGYDWGNSSSGSAKLFLNINSDSIKTFMPWLSVNAEHYESNIENMKYKIRAAYTGGYMLSLNSGFDYFDDRIGIGVEAGIPIKSDLSDGYSSMKINIGCRLMWFINNSNKKQTQIKSL